MPTPQQFDAIIIGSGQGGNPLAMALAAAGMHTALIERKHVGGTCINEGCTPTKTMVASGRVAYLARRAADYGVHTGPITIDMAKVRQRKRDIVDRFRNGSQTRIENTANLELIFGEASFSGPKTIAVRTQDGGQRAESEDGKEAAHYSSTISICRLPASSSSLRVTGSEYFGSSHSITMKNLSCVTCEKRRCLSSRW